MADVTNQDKVALTGGQDFWTTNPVPDAGLESIMLTDGPHGVRKQSSDPDHLGLGQSEPATCFPPAVGLSTTWNPELVGRVGVALGEETRALKVGVLLGPGANLKRDPRCGRNFEYFSEDPFLTGELASAFVKGVQSQGVGTSLKHFAANNQETDRMRRDSQVDIRTLRELYLRGFGKVVMRSQPWTVMCSYNKVNGVQASENHWLLTEVLRDEWGFEGVVVSDWGAVWDRVRALKAGLDLEMPVNAPHEAAALNALETGELDQATLDTAYGRVAALVGKAQASLADAPDSFDVDGHHRLGREVAEQAIVLLSNDGVLPLAPATNVAVVGEFARTPRYQGAGSSRVNPTRLDNALDRITDIIGHEVPFAPGFTTAPGQVLPSTAVADAAAVASGADVVLVFLGLGEAHESEGYDRDTLDLPAEQLEVLEAVLAANANVVVVLSNGSSVLLPFASRVRAVVEGWLLGQAGNPALADVLFGLVNPSGKLTETIPIRLQDAPSYVNFPGDVTGVRYGEGLFVGYRGYDRAETDVAFPFGHGLSYTTFAYSEVSVAEADGGIRVEVTVTNTGQRAGREVVQAYVGKPSSAVVRVPRELKGFASVTLEPGASGRVSIGIPAEELAYWSVIDHAWVVESGEYVVEVGASSRDLRGSGSVQLAGNEPQRKLTIFSSMGEAMTNPVFAQAVGAMMANSPFAEADSADLGADMAKMMADFPLAALLGFTGGDPEQFQQLLDAANA